MQVKIHVFDGMGRFEVIGRLPSHSRRENVTFELSSRGSLTNPPSELRFPTMLARNVPLKRTSAQGRQGASLENHWTRGGGWQHREAQPPKKTFAQRSSWP